MYPPMRATFLQESSDETDGHQETSSAVGASGTSEWDGAVVGSLGSRSARGGAGWCVCLGRSWGSSWGRRWGNGDDAGDVGRDTGGDSDGA